MASSVGQSSQFSKADAHDPFAHLLAQLASSDKSTLLNYDKLFHMKILFNKVKTQIPFLDPTKVRYDNKIKFHLPFLVSLSSKTYSILIH